jgi:hypothetical protein
MLNKFRLSLLIALVVCIIGSISCSPARKTLVLEEGWELIGETKVGHMMETDEIPVDTNKLYTMIRFKVEDQEVRVDQVKIIFTNGDKLEPKIADAIKPAEFSKDVDLGYEGKSISRIQFRYKTPGSVLKGKATVMVFGKKY